MKRVMTLALVCLLLGNAPLPTATAQQAQLAYKLNPQIEKIVGDISPANIEATVRKLVSFGTRHTFSDAESPTRGIGAALDQVGVRALQPGVGRTLRGDGR